MSTEVSKATTRHLGEVINTANEEALLELLIPDVIDHYSLLELPAGREGWNMKRKMLRAAFPDAPWHEEELFAEEERVLGRYTLHGTQLGEFLGIPPTGKSITVSNIHVMRLVDGKIVEQWGHGDDMGMISTNQSHYVSLKSSTRRVI